MKQMSQQDFDSMMLRVFSRQADYAANSNFYIKGWDRGKFSTLFQAFAEELGLIEIGERDGLKEDCPDAAECGLFVGQLIRHVKSGGLYHIISFAQIESDLTPVVVYRAAYGDRDTWVRPAWEFFDGRFEDANGQSLRPCVAER